MDIVSPSFFNISLKVFFGITLALTVCGTIGSVLNIMVFYRDKSIRVFTRILFIYQAAMDLLSSIFVSSFTMYTTFSLGDFRLGQPVLCGLTSIIFYVLLYGSGFTSITIAIDRMLLVRFPTNRFVKRLTHYHAVIEILALNVIHFGIFGNFYQTVELVGFCTPIALLKLDYNFALLLAYGVVPFLLNCGSSMYLLYKVRGSRRVKQNQNDNGLNEAAQKQIWAIKMIAVVSMYSLISFSPSVIILFLYNTGNIQISYEIQVISYYSYLLLMTNFYLRFVFYYFSALHFRLMLLKIICPSKYRSRQTQMTNVEQSQTR